MNGITLIKREFLLWNKKSRKLYGTGKCKEKSIPDNTSFLENKKMYLE